MTDFFEDVGRIEFEDKVSFRAALFEKKSAEYLGKKIIAGELKLDFWLKYIKDDEKTPLKRSFLQRNI